MINKVIAITVLQTEQTFHTQQSVEFTPEWCNKEKSSSERQFCGRKHLVERDERRTDRLFGDRKTTVTHNHSV